MSDVKVPMNEDNAVLLLEAAQKLEQEPDVVRTTTQGHFLVPEEVADKAGVTVIDEGDGTEKKTAKKTAAKKTTSAKSANKE